MAPILLARGSSQRWPNTAHLQGGQVCSLALQVGVERGRDLAGALLLRGHSGAECGLHVCEAGNHGVADLVHRRGVGRLSAVAGIQPAPTVVSLSYPGNMLAIVAAEC